MNAISYCVGVFLQFVSFGLLPQKEQEPFLSKEAIPPQDPAIGLRPNSTPIDISIAITANATIVSNTTLSMVYFY